MLLVVYCYPDLPCQLLGDAVFQKCNDFIASMRQMEEADQFGLYPAEVGRRRADRRQQCMNANRCERTSTLTNQQHTSPLESSTSIIQATTKSEQKPRLTAATRKGFR